MKDYLSQLNPQQRDAVLYTDGPSLVIAGAGSGKTRVLTYKIIHLLAEGYDAKRILALTFTNKAANEMKERISLLINDDRSSKIWMGTFHSIFLKLLRFNCDRINFKPGFTIYDATDSKTLIKTIIKEFDLDDKSYKVSTIQSQISNIKNALISPERYSSDHELVNADNKAGRPAFHLIYKEYWKRCKIANAMDFDDILFYTNILLRDNPDILKKYQDYFQYILVDEYQDTNFAQHLIISQLCKANRKLCVVGDDAQSIYSFRGANIKNILHLDRQFPDLKIFKLEQNYRSTQNIINAANSLIEKNKSQIPKKIFSENQEGARIPVIESYSGYEESYVVANKIIELKRAKLLSYDDFAILYRTNAQSRILEEALRKRNIPYKIYGGLSFYQRKEVKDVVSYFRLAVNPDDDEALRRIINFPQRGIGESTIKKLQEKASELGCSLWGTLSDDHIYSLKVNKGTLAKLQLFKGLIEKFIKMNLNGVDAEQLAKSIVADAHLLAVYANENTPENISKQENISELVSGAVEFVASRQEEGNDNVSLSNFLSEISLATDQDGDSDYGDGARVTLMTIHAAKGLEFPIVFIVGVEEELFPARMSSDSIAGIEEERRLMYVAITRAMTNCIITYANSRYINGQTKMCSKSRFISDIENEYLSFSSTATSSSFSSDSYHSSIKNNTYDYPREESKYNRYSSYSGGAAPKNVFSESKRSTSFDFAKSGNDTSGCTLHSVKELSAGMKISHSRFGRGIITEIDDKSTDPKIIVTFTELGSKTLLLKFAKFQIIE